MKISALIQKLNQHKAKHGDLDVLVDVDSFPCQVEDVNVRRGGKHLDVRVIIYLGQTEGVDY
jgi:hypothetical protein